MNPTPDLLWKATAISRSAIAISFGESKRDEEGATLVEWGISSVIFFAVLFSIIQLSLALYAYNYVNYAAREASRYAMVRGSSYTTACTSAGFANCVAQPGSSGDIQQFVQKLGFPGIDSSNIVVTTSWPGDVGVCTPSADPCNNPGNLVKVVVSYPLSIGIPFLNVSTLNLSSTSEMVITQ